MARPRVVTTLVACNRVPVILVGSDVPHAVAEPGVWTLGLKEEQHVPPRTSIPIVTVIVQQAASLSSL